MILILDIIGATFGIIGAILVMYKMKSGYITFGICNLAYMLLGILQGTYGLVVLSLILIIIDVCAYIKWYKEDNKIYNNML